MHYVVSADVIERHDFSCIFGVVWWYSRLYVDGATANTMSASRRQLVHVTSSPLAANPPMVNGAALSSPLSGSGPSPMRPEDIARMLQDDGLFDVLSEM